MIFQNRNAKQCLGKDILKSKMLRNDLWPNTFKIWCQEFGPECSASNKLSNQHLYKSLKYSIFHFFQLVWYIFLILNNSVSEILVSPSVIPPKFFLTSSCFFSLLASALIQIQYFDLHDYHSASTSFPLSLLGKPDLDLAWKNDFGSLWRSF